MVKYDPAKRYQFITSFSMDQHIFVFSRSQPCLKFRQYAYRKCKFNKIGIEASQANAASLAFTLQIGQNRFYRFGHATVGCQCLLYKTCDRS
jgi:hypothetical protein